MTGSSTKLIRYIAFLRAINVGGRTIKMDALRALFLELDFANVETFIASGNVIFDAPAAETRQLETRIEQHLQAALGYTVDTFIRTTAELAAIAAVEPFPPADLNADDTTLYIAFLNAIPATDAAQKVAALATPTDTFRIHERELYWLVRGKLSESKITGAMLEKSVGVPATMRNRNTVQRLAAKYPATT